MDQQVTQMVNSIMHEQFEVPMEDLVATANLKADLKLDSLDFVDMVVILEEKVGGQMPNIDFLSIQTLGDVYNLVETLFESKKKSV
ncbi:MAG: phosphopantetheine-binding protein [Pseudobdellovibrio sp.]